LQSDRSYIFDEIAKRRGYVARPFSVLLNSPDLASKVAAVGEYLIYMTSMITPEVREIVTLATARALDSEYVWSRHVPLAREAGVRDEVIDVIGHKVSPRRLLPKEGVFLQFTHELLIDKRIRDATFGAVEHLLGSQGTMELVVLIGYYALLCNTVAAFQVELEDNIPNVLPEAT